MFKELHKLAVVFEVEWLKNTCRDWLRGKMKSATTDMEKDFVFSESWYIFDKWGEKDMEDGLASVLALKDNETFISGYVVDLNRLKEGEIDILLKLGGSNTELFLKILLNNLASQIGLGENVTHLLQKMNLALCSEVNEELYLEVFDTIASLSEITVADLQLTSRFRSDTARLVSSRKQNRRRTTLIYGVIKNWELLNSCNT